jgi:hypothetical protein
MECRRPLSPPCSCPIRLTFKTVDSTIGRLRSAFNDLGREGRDNPAAARAVKTYLKDITNEQLMVGLVPEQAIPVFSGKLRVVSLVILEALADASGVLRFSLLRTRAMLLVAMVSLPPTRKAVGRDENRIDYALPGRPRPPLQLCFW